MWLVVVTAAWSQAYEAQPCEADAELAAELATGEVSGVGPVGPRFWMTSATSLLPPSSSAKPDLEAARKLLAAHPVELGDEDAGLARVAADLHSCTYGPTNLLDGDPATAWCEGAAGAGVGEAVLLKLPGAGTLQIVNGYSKSPDRFAQNGRVERVEVVLLGQGWNPPVQGSYNAALPVLGRHEVTLTDVRTPQPLPLPEWSVPADWAPDVPSGWNVAEQVPTFVALRILSTYAGSKWEDTCLSEVRSAP
jgi:hypothetical protein